MSAYSQVAINSGALPAAPSSMLDVTSTSKGVLLPRMTSSQRKAITDPEMGLLVYDTDRQTIYLFDGVNWKPMMVTLDNLAPLISRQAIGGHPVGGFGGSVDIYDNYAVVGAPEDTVNSVMCGAAYIFFKENGTWKQQAKIHASNAASGDEFGASVSIYNDLIVIGAPGKTISGLYSRGRVYVFKRTGRIWSQVLGVQASNGLAGDRFGTAVAIDGSMFVAGAPYTDYNAKTDAGSAYVFRFENNTWIEKKILNPADPTNSGNAGHAVDIWGTRVAVGAPYATVSGVLWVGAVYMFNNIDLWGTSWENGQKLEPDIKQAQMKFGHAIDLEWNRMLIGAPDYEHPGAAGAGRGFIFKNVNGIWNNYGTLNSMTAYDHAGMGVAIDGDYSFFSYPGWEDNKGRVVFFNTNTPFKYLYDEDRDAARYFGKAIAAHNGQFIIGAPGYISGARVFFGVLD